MGSIRFRGRVGTPPRDEVTFRSSALIAVAFVALALWPSSSGAADFTPLLRASPCDGQCVSAWDLSGEIKPGDDIELRSLIEGRERQNLTMRMSMRRFTRLTNAFSKKVENLHAAVALHFAHYNFVRMHKTLRMTPAMAANVSDRLWSLEELVERTSE
jgi:hypothetical protein